MIHLSTSPTIPLSFAPCADGYSHIQSLSSGDTNGSSDKEETNEFSPIFNCTLAGAFGGLVGDTSMHALDTVKTRQQGLFNRAKYNNMVRAYITIFKEEGFFRGLYGGYSPALSGSIPSTAAFFGTYEFMKRKLINDLQVNETLSYLIAGVLGDLASSVFYVPSEVLKTRLQLQGRYNNPYTIGCGYNYNGLFDAIRTISRKEGLSTFVFGYKETLFRDLPFSALQFAFYEKFRQFAIIYNGSDDLSVPLELLTGSSAGGLAGILTTPLDVIKTRIQTTTSANAFTTFASQNAPSKRNFLSFISRFSILNALSSIYKAEGIFGLFSGVGPRFIWTGIQSSIMLFLYQFSLKKLDALVPNPSEAFRNLRSEF